MHFLTKKQALDFVHARSNLFDLAAATNPFASASWVLHFISQVAEDDWIFVVPEHQANEQSLMLLYREPRTPYRCSAATNYYASLFSPLISSARDRRAALDALVGQLHARRTGISVATFAPLDENAADTVALRDAFFDRGWYVRRYFCFGNWYLPCADLSFQDYMSQRDSRLYNTWSRKTKKFSMKSGAVDAGRLEMITNPEDVQSALDAYDTVYAKSWKKPEPYPNFVGDWAKVCAKNGWLRLGLAWAGTVPIAAQFWFTVNRRAYIFKLAYDEEYSNWSAGTVLTAHMIQHSLEIDRVIEIDYLTGDDAYKQSWMTARRERIGYVACNLRTSRGLMTAGRELAGELRQRWRARHQVASHPLTAATTCSQSMTFHASPR